MVESPDFIDPVHGIPVFSLYGEVRRPTPAMMDTFDVLLVDLQDLGCRIYTFITTLRYVLEAAAAARASRCGCSTVRIRPAVQSKAHAARRLGELRRRRRDADAARTHARRAWRAGSCARSRLDVEYRVIEMEGWQPGRAPGFGWPLGERTWVNPSPNAPNLWMARCYAGHGDARRHDAIRRPRHHAAARALRRTRPRCARAARRRCRRLAPRMAARLPTAPCWFEPTFHKHAGKLCAGVQIHVEDAALRSRRVSAVAPAGARVQGDCAAAAGLRAVARLSRTSTSTIGSRSI